MRLWPREKEKKRVHPLRQATLDTLDRSILACNEAEAALDRGEPVDSPAMVAFTRAQHEALAALDAWEKAGMP